MLCFLGQLPFLQDRYNHYFFKIMVRNKDHVYKRFGLLWFSRNFSDYFNYMYWFRDI